MKNIYGLCSTIIDQKNDIINFDLELFLQRLFMFDEFTMSSIRLKEIPLIANFLGIDGLEAILNDSSLKIHCEALTTVQTGQFAMMNREILPLYNYRFDSVATVYDEYIRDVLKEVKNIPNATAKQKHHLRDMIRNKLVVHNSDTKFKIVEKLEADIQNTEIINASLSSVIKHIICENSDLIFKVHKINESHFYVENNIKNILKIDEKSAHELIERALLNIGGLEKRIYEMYDFKSLSGFESRNDYELFRIKYSPFEEKHNSNQYIDNFSKVVEIRNLPNFSQIIKSGKMRIDKLIGLKYDRDFIEFREWMWNINDFNSKEIESRLKSINSKIGNSISSTSGKVIRGIISNVSGFLGPIGIPISIIDSYVIDYIFKRDGVKAFLDDKYPSLYK